jgi:hypothetical protein
LQIKSGLTTVAKYADAFRTDSCNLIGLTDSEGSVQAEVSVEFDREKLTETETELKAEVKKTLDAYFEEHTELTYSLTKMDDFEGKYAHLLPITLRHFH